MEEPPEESRCNDERWARGSRRGALLEHPGAAERASHSMFQGTSTCRTPFPSETGAAGIQTQISPASLPPHLPPGDGGGAGFRATLHFPYFVMHLFYLRALLASAFQELNFSCVFWFVIFFKWVLVIKDVWKELFSEGTGVIWMRQTFASGS